MHQVDVGVFSMLVLKQGHEKRNGISPRPVDGTDGTLGRDEGETGYVENLCRREDAQRIKAPLLHLGPDDFSPSIEFTVTQADWHSRPLLGLRSRLLPSYGQECQETNDGLPR